MPLPHEILNQDALYAARQQLVNSRDNLYRAQHAPANWKSGNGEGIEEVIKGYQKEVNRWLEVIEYLESKVGR